MKRGGVAFVKRDTELIHTDLLIGGQFARLRFSAGVESAEPDTGGADGNWKEDSTISARPLSLVEAEREREASGLVSRTAAVVSARFLRLEREREASG